MKLILLITTTLVLCFSSLHAQVPGFQGKRFFAEIGGSFFFNVAFPTAQNVGPKSFPYGENTGHFTLKDRYSLSLHYVIGRLVTFKVAYHYQVSGLHAKTSTPSLFQSGSDQHDLFYQLHMHDVNLGFNLYKRRGNSLAPLGFYWDLGIRCVFVNGVLRDQRVEYANNRADHTPYADQLNPIDNNNFVFLFGITGMWGYRTVIANRLILNVGIETSIFPQYVLALTDGRLPIIGGSRFTDYQIKSIQSVQDRYLLSIHVGIGALLF